MIGKTIVSVLLICQPFLLAATPMDQVIPECKETLIECEYSLDEPDIKRTIHVVPQKGIYHYRVYLPEGYSKSAPKRYPCIFIAAAGGNASFSRNLREYVIKNKWIAVMLVESKNGPWGPITGCFLATHDDAVKRFRIQEGMKYATGVSGGARASSFNASIRPGFAGVILQAAGWGWTDNEYRYNIFKGNTFAV